MVNTAIALADVLMNYAFVIQQLLSVNERIVMKTLNTFDFASVAGARRGKWNWSLLTNGQIHQLERGTDYTAKYAAAQIRKYAESKQRKVNVAFGNPGDDKVIVQFANDKGEFITAAAPVAKAPTSKKTNKR